MLQVLGICARMWLAGLLACLCAFALTGWVTTGLMDLAPAWVLWLLGGLWANPLARVVTLAAVALDSWNRLTMRQVWS